MKNQCSHSLKVTWQKLGKLTFLLSAIILCPQAYAGPSIALQCYNEQSKEHFLAYDLDPKTIMYNLSGYAPSLAGSLKYYSLVLNREFNYKFKTRVLEYNDQLVELQIQDEEGNLPQILLHEQNRIRANTPTTSLGKLKSLSIENLHPVRLGSSESRKANVTLNLESDILESISYQNCEFSGARTENWWEMWNRQ